MKLNTKIDNLKNIGKKRLEALNVIGIATVEDLVNYLPRNYEDRSKVVKIENYIEEQYATILVEIEKVEVLSINRLIIVRAKAYDDTGDIDLIWFNQRYLKKTLKKNVPYKIFGKFKYKFNQLGFEVKDFEIFSKDSIHKGIIPIYTLPRGFSQKVFRGIMYDALSELDEEVKEYLNDEIKKELKFPTYNWAVRHIHFFEDKYEFYKARERLVFDELFLTSGAMNNIKILAKQKTNVKIRCRNWEELDLPYELTNAQKKVMEEIQMDLQKDETMNRLIQGDVGSGKTLIAIITAYLVVKSGYQCVVMAPTEVLANQHFKEFNKYFLKLGIKVELLVGSLSAKNKKLVQEKIENGDIDVVIGTHAVIQDKVKFKNLALAITDEQHRFGVKQRSALNEKGNAHVLVMTATPIPRTLGLIVYGDLDVSTIDQLPPGRQSIDTFFVNTTYRERLFNFIEKEIVEHQVYVICPAIEENENTSLTSVTSYYDLIKKRFPNDEIAILHGKMKQSEKDEVMEEFSANKIKILISTTVIEVGVNVPNATLMIVEDSHRFGLSQLHQLRGRVGRGKSKSYCILVSDSKSKLTKERLNIMCTTSSGFELSEKDLKLRGHGDFFGNRQHGIPEFKIANLYEDVNILKKVKILWDKIETKEITLSEHEKEIIQKKLADYVGLTYTSLPL
ncbi:MAG: ATP-dependent DNA helicase RecG [Lachnospirales bacterium]